MFWSERDTDMRVQFWIYSVSVCFAKKCILKCNNHVQFLIDWISACFDQKEILIFVYGSELIEFSVCFDNKQILKSIMFLIDWVSICFSKRFENELSMNCIFWIDWILVYFFSSTGCFVLFSGAVLLLPEFQL